MASSVTQIVASISQKHGGPSYSVPALTSALVELGEHSVLRTISDPLESRSAHFGPETVAYRPSMWIFRNLGASRSLYRALHQDAQNGSILHTHGLWLLPNLYPASIKRKHAQTLVVHSPRGMLAQEALAISSWKKRPVWHLWQRAALESADCIHATAVSEYEEVRAAGLQNPVAIIPNGIHVPEEGYARSPTQSGQKSVRTILSIGRMHPKKALDNLVRAWADLEHRYPGWRVRIIGPAERGHDDDLRRLSSALGLARLSVEGPLYGDAKAKAYEAADVFVLPTKNENFGISVAEALSFGLPVISSKGAPWAGLECHKLRWWVDYGHEPLVSALAIAMDTPPEKRVEMGTRGREWMSRDFSWNRVASDMSAVYHWLRAGGPHPQWVRID